MLLDVLSGFDELKICTAYDIDGHRTEEFPSHVEDLQRAKPVYRSIPGWQEDLTTFRKLGQLPAAARNYLDTICELIGRPPAVVSVGPGREQTIVLDP